MTHRPEGGVFRREASWLLVLTVVIPAAGLVIALLLPWALRRLR